MPPNCACENAWSTLSRLLSPWDGACDKSDGRFYPDFICQLPAGPVLAVEYKGAQGRTDAADDRLIGGLWS